MILADCTHQSGDRTLANSSIVECEVQGSFKASDNLFCVK